MGKCGNTACLASEKRTGRIRRAPFCRSLAAASELLVSNSSPVLSDGAEAYLGSVFAISSRSAAMGSGALIPDHCDE